MDILDFSRLLYEAGGRLEITDEEVKICKLTCSLPVFSFSWVDSDCPIDKAILINHPRTGGREEISVAFLKELLGN